MRFHPILASLLFPVNLWLTESLVQSSPHLQHQEERTAQQQGSTVTKPLSGTSAQTRGRRQLPQTPLTPQPAVAYKTPTSSAATPSASTPGSRFVEGASEHDRLLAAHE